MEVKRCGLIVGLSLCCLSACSLFLDFDLTGNQLDGGGASEAGPPSDSDATTPEGGTDAGPYIPPFGPLLCGDSFDLCDGFEDRAAPVGGPIFTRALGQGVGFTTTRHAAERQSLEVVRPATDAPDDGFLLAENVAFPRGRGHVELQIILAIEAPTPAKERTIAVVRPFPTIDDPNEARVRIVLRPTGLFVEARQFGGGAPNAVYKFDDKVLDGKYHTVLINTFFGTGRFTAALDGPYLVEDAALTLNDGNIGAAYSIALGASAPAGGGAVTARFDNIRIRHD
jgi:hypothetical protein